MGLGGGHFLGRFGGFSWACIIFALLEWLQHFFVTTRGWQIFTRVPVWMI